MLGDAASHLIVARLGGGHVDDRTAMGQSWRERFGVAALAAARSAEYECEPFARAAWAR